MSNCLKRFIFNCLISGLLTMVIISSGSVAAEERRHHGAHEHGVASLNIAIERNNVYIEFSSPAANIVGFEHHPRTHEQKDAVKNAVMKLQEGDALFVLSAASKSKLVKSNVETDIDKDADHHSESEHGHGEERHHGNEEHHDKDSDHHSESEHTHGDEGHHDEEHSEADEHERHSEFKAEYHFVCNKPGKLSQIDVNLFRLFPAIEHIEVQLLNETKQTAVELTAKKTKISL